MTGRDPLEHGWWLASRASGVVAIVLVAVSVGIGLGMAGKVLRRPGWPRIAMAVHEHTALAALIAIAVHGITLLGDRWLAPGPLGIAVPLVADYRPVWTGLGILGGHLAALLGLSFYFRRRLGARHWRLAHRFTPLVYVLALAHTLGAGTDARTLGLQALLVLTGAPVLFLLTLRMLAPRPAHARRAAASENRVQGATVARR